MKNKALSAFSGSLDAIRCIFGRCLLWALLLVSSYNSSYAISSCLTLRIPPCPYRKTKVERWMVEKYKECLKNWRDQFKKENGAAIEVCHQEVLSTLDSIPDDNALKAAHKSNSLERIKQQKALLDGKDEGALRDRFQKEKGSSADFTLLARVGYSEEILPRIPLECEELKKDLESLLPTHKVDYRNDKQGEQILAIFDASGNYKWEVPTGVTEITVEVIGAGASAFNGNGSANDGACGSQLTQAFSDLKEGEVLTMHVGRGGHSLRNNGDPTWVDFHGQHFVAAGGNGEAKAGNTLQCTWGKGGRISVSNGTGSNGAVIVRYTDPKVIENQGKQISELQAKLAIQAKAMQYSMLLVESKGQMQEFDDFVNGLREISPDVKQALDRIDELKGRLTSELALECASFYNLLNDLLEQQPELIQKLNNALPVSST